MAPDSVVKQRVLSLGSTATVEALETDVEASRVVLWRGGKSRGWSKVSFEGGESAGRRLHTIESKHCVQSSLYTD